MDDRYIYGLVDPRFPHEYRYIGETHNLSVRLKRHIMASSIAAKSPVALWVWGLRLEGLLPEIVFINKIENGKRYGDKSSTEIESMTIKEMLDRGHPLLNKREWRNRMSASGIPACVVASYINSITCMVRARKEQGENCRVISNILTGSTLEIESEYPQISLWNGGFFNVCPDYKNFRSSLLTA